MQITSRDLIGREIELIGDDGIAENIHQFNGEAVDKQITRYD